MKVIFNADVKGKAKKGEMIAAYIENEIGGFAIHLCVKY